jgi:hypothetical protein
MNEKLALKSFLDLTLMQHPSDEDPNPWKVCICFEVNPPQAWYYHISSNSYTLVIFLQVDPTSGDEPKIIYEGCYEIEDTSIFIRSSIPYVGHYRWLHGLICQLPLNSKADYLVCTIRRLLDFL